MAEYSINASVRKDMTKSYRKNLWKQGLVPAVLYGKTAKNLSLEVPEKEIQRVLRSGRNTIVTLAVSGNGGSYKVMVKDLQLDPLKKNILHADFQQISMKDKIHATIPIHLSGEAEFGLAQLDLRELEISCLPSKIPAQITVDVSGMKPGDHISVSDLQLPKEVAVITEQDKIVVTVLSEVEETAEPDEKDLPPSDPGNGTGEETPEE